jgi:uncharacterized protein YqjF (DUF2071 family)
MSCEEEKEEALSQRAEGPPAELQGRYRPVNPERRSLPGSLEHFLTERYCLYAVDRGRVYRAVIHHLPWPLQPAQAELEVNTMLQAAGLPLSPAAPLLHFSRESKVYVWPPQRAAG